MKNAFKIFWITHSPCYHPPHCSPVYSKTLPRDVYVLCIQFLSSRSLLNSVMSDNSMITAKVFSEIWLSNQLDNYFPSSYLTYQKQLAQLITPFVETDSWLSIQDSYPPNFLTSPFSHFCWSLFYILCCTELSLLFLTCISLSVVVSSFIALKII